MRISFGLEDYAFRQKDEKIPVIWDTSRIVNGHILIVGRSGSGKTTLLRRFFSQAQTQSNSVRVHVMDVHGDIDINGASRVQFSESTDFGLNPLKISEDPHFGGVRKRVQSFIATLNRTSSRVLGPKQEAALRNILMDLYAANGFYPDKPESWRLNDGVQRRFPKKFPNIEDAHRFAYAKLKQMFLGSDIKAVKALEEVNRKATALQSKLKRFNGAQNSEIEKLETEFKRVGELAIEAFTDYVENIKTGQELDSLLKYDSAEVMKSVADRLENMRATGIFKNQLPPFDSNAQIWRYDIRALSEEEKRMFVEFRLQEIFAEAVQRGPVSEIKDMICLDEAHQFFRDDEDNILNTIAKEARKFGVALICASQSPTHFSDDFIANVGTKVILGIDQMYWDGTVRKMRIEPKMLDYVVPLRTIAVQINNKADAKSQFKQVAVGKGSSND